MARKYNKDNLPEGGWQAAINEAVASGNLSDAAYYEQQRNEKINWIDADLCEDVVFAAIKILKG